MAGSLKERKMKFLNEKFEHSAEYGMIIAICGLEQQPEYQKKARHDRSPSADD